MHHGRQTGSTKNIAIELGVSNYIIAGNGSAVYDIKNQTVIHDRFLSKEQVLKIAKICKENSIYYSVYTEEEALAEALEFNILFYYKENFKKTEDRRTHINVVQDIETYIKETEKDKFLKITVCDETEMIFNSIIRKLREIQDMDVLDVEYMSRKFIKSGTEDVPIQYYYTEITNKNVNKWTAIEFLMKKFNITREEVLVIGDNINDKEMIENAGLGIVMGNSNPHMKEIGDVIVADNDSEGVLEALEKYVLA